MRSIGRKFVAAGWGLILLAIGFKMAVAAIAPYLPYVIIGAGVVFVVWAVWRVSRALSGSRLIR